MIDASKQFPALMRRIEDIVRRLFPISSLQHVMTVSNLHWINHGEDVMNNIAVQKDFKLKGKTLSAKLLGDIDLRTVEGGPVDRAKNFVLVTLPHITARSSYIVEGHEVQTVNQLRLKPGPYTRFTVSNDTETFINAAGGGYRIVFERTSGRLLLRTGTANILLYPILKGLGITDSEMERAWGSEVLNFNRSKEKPDEVVKLFQKMRKFADVPPAGADLTTAVDSFFRSKALDPRVSKITLGKEYAQITPHLLLDASQKAVDLANGNAKADDTESLAFKSIHAVDDLVPEKLERAIPAIQREIAYKMDKKPSISSLISPATLSSPVMAWFTTSEFTRYSDQNNPIDMVGTVNLTTTMGEGGIKSLHSVKDELRLVHPSHMGFLDPVHTPEGSKIGITGHLALGTEKRGTDLVITLIDVKTGEFVKKTPQEIDSAVIAFNDQYKLSGARPKPLYPSIKAKVGTKIEMVPSSSVQYIFKEPRGFFSIVTNAIPFLHNNSPNRVLMADRHIEQSVALKDPDIPMVQSRFSGDMGYHDFFGKSFNPRSSVDGTVVKVTKDTILVKGPKGVETVYIHDHYPLNGDAFLHDTPIVKVGDKVKKGQMLAENNFTKDKALSFSKYLNTAYMAYKGHNYEDGVVISEGASKKLTSVHKYDLKLDRTPTMKIGLKMWSAHYPDKAAMIDQSKYDSDGIIKKGAELLRGMVVIPAIDQMHINEEMAYAKLHKSLKNPFCDVSIYWDEDAKGKVIDIVKTSGMIRVLVETEEQAQVGDKLSNSGGGKGIITLILPDNEMIHDEKGKPLDLLFNPGSVAGRVNPGQLFEGSAAKIALKTGKKYLVDNFSDESTVHKIKAELAANGLKDTETVTDPTTNLKTENVFVAPVPFFKLKHQIRHKFSAKGIGPYTGEAQPSKISGESAQNIGTGELYALMSGGSTHFLRDVATIKSQANPEYWRAVQTGMPLPPPKAPYILDKFVNYLEGAGAHVLQDGTNLKVLPMTDKDVLARSKGEIANPGVVRATDLKPEAGGLFDRGTTGGFGGVNWTHIALESSIPNPMMERPIISLTNLKPAEFKQIIAGTLYVTRDGSITTDHTKGKGCGEGLKILLDKIDVGRELSDTLLKIRTAKADQLDALNKKRRYLEALKASGIKPSDAYLQKYIPVIPPAFRPMYPLPDGALNVADANHSYREILMVNSQLKDLKAKGVDDKNLASLRANLYAAVQGMTGLTEPLTRGAHFKGFIATIKGRQNKYGLFQGKVVKRPQDLSARSTAIPNPKMGLDTVGIPEDMGLTIYRPFIVRRLVNTGISPTAAGDMIDKKDKRAIDALNLEVKERPVYMNRAPTLHKFGLMAFKPVIVQGKAIQTNPLINSGFNLDYDGDTLGIHVPVSEEARREAFTKLPSNHLMSVTGHGVMHAPSREYMLGLYLMSCPKGNPSTAKSIPDMLSKYQSKAIKVNTPVIIGGKVWTAGQALINDVLPSGAKIDNKIVTKSVLQDLTRIIGREHKKEAGDIISKLKDLGAHFVTEVGFSIGLDDLTIDYKKRDAILAEAAKQSKKVGFDKAYTDAVGKIQSLVKEHKDNRFVEGNITSGAFGKAEQIAQMVATPVAMAGHRGEIIKVPITKSFAEGHDIASYWANIPGSRKGLMEKGLGTQDVGALSKRLVNTTIQLVVSESDCGTQNGVELPVDSMEAIDRVIAKGPGKGSVLTPEMARAFKSKGMTVLQMRSPLKCISAKGVCQKCYGLTENGQFPAIGFPIGSLVGQAVSEPVIQTMLRGFHTGGAVSKSAVGFDRIEQLFEMPENISGQATLAMASGAVTGVATGIGGGWNVTVGNRDHFIPKELGLGVKKGDRVAAGQKLSSTGIIKPQDLLEATGDINRVRDQLITDLDKEYSAGGVKVRRKLFEAAIRPMTDRAEVLDAGDGERLGVHRGDVLSVNRLDEMNKTIGKGKKIAYVSTLLPIRLSPFKGEDFIGKLMFERPHETLRDAPAFGASVNLAKAHPVTQFAFGTFKKK